MDESNELMSVRRIEVFVCETAPRSGVPLRLKRFLFAHHPTPRPDPHRYRVPERVAQRKSCTEFHLQRQRERTAREQTRISKRCQERGQHSKYGGDNVYCVPPSDPEPRVERDHSLVTSRSTDTESKE